MTSVAGVEQREKAAARPAGHVEHPAPAQAMGAREPLELAEPSLVGVAVGQQVVDVGQRVVGRGGGHARTSRPIGQRVSLVRLLARNDSSRLPSGGAGGLGLGMGAQDLLGGGTARPRSERSGRGRRPGGGDQGVAPPRQLSHPRAPASVARGDRAPRGVPAARHIARGVAGDRGRALRGGHRRGCGSRRRRPPCARPSSPRATGSCCWHAIGAICRNTRSRTCSACPMARPRFGFTACAHSCARPCASHDA